MDDVRSTLLGLEGFTVVDAVEAADATVVVTVETTVPALACPDCGEGPGLSKGRPAVWLRDVRLAARPVRVLWRKRRRCCLNEGCERVSFTEQHPAVGWRRRSTMRFRRECARRVGRRAHPVSEVAADHGVSW